MFNAVTVPPGSGIVEAQYAFNVAKGNHIQLPPWCCHRYAPGYPLRTNNNGRAQNTANSATKVGSDVGYMGDSVYSQSVTDIEKGRYTLKSNSMPVTGYMT